MTEYTMDDFHAEMKRRGVNTKWKRVMFRYERERRTRAPSQRKRHPVLSTIDRANERIDALRALSPTTVVACPWGDALGGCVEPCRCGMTGRVSVGFLIAQYERVAAEAAEGLK